jgi:hypothetical protein
VRTLSAAGDSGACRNGLDEEAAAVFDGTEAAPVARRPVTRFAPNAVQQLMKGGNEMPNQGTKTLLWVGVAILGASITGCLADDTDRAATASGDEEAVIGDERPLAGVGDQSIDPDLADASIDSTRYLLFVYANGSTYTVADQPGRRDSTKPATEPGNGWPIEAINHCSTRVWLYQYADYTGATLCLNPNTHTGTLYSTWRRFYISTNSAPCH